LLENVLLVKGFDEDGLFSKYEGLKDVVTVSNWHYSNSLVNSYGDFTVSVNSTADFVKLAKDAYLNTVEKITSLLELNNKKSDVSGFRNFIDTYISPLTLSEKEELEIKSVLDLSDCYKEFTKDQEICFNNYLNKLRNLANTRLKKENDFSYEVLNNCFRLYKLLEINAPSFIIETSKKELALSFIFYYTSKFISYKEIDQ